MNFTFGLLSYFVIKGDNGNMVTDLDRNIVTIRYNLLNLPDTVQFRNGAAIVNYYTADGVKYGTKYLSPLASAVIPEGDTFGDMGGALPMDSHVSAWQGALEYEGDDFDCDSLIRIHNRDGYLDYPEQEFRYYARDYQGNVRTVYGKALKILPVLDTTIFLLGKSPRGGDRITIDGDKPKPRLGRTVTYQRIQYYPFGLPYDAGFQPGEQPYKYGGKEFIEMHGYDSYDFDARIYYPALGRFTTMDPLCEKYYSVSPYAYCGNNPIRYIDPEGLAPIYAPDGTFLGTDDEGLYGPQLILNKDDFTQGMPHANAQKVLWTGVMTQEARAKMDEHVAGLSSRPDYDGFVTIAEGIAWAKDHPNALKSPTPDNTLYIDASKLDFGGLSTSDFENVGEIKSQNLFDLPLLKSALLYTLRNTVYALGRVDMILVNREQKTVRIVNNSATDYDWNLGGGAKRNLFIKAERRRAGLNDTHGFKTFYYGLGRLKK